MKKLILLLLSLTLIAISCKSTKKIKDSVVFSLDKHPGRGIGPEYSLKIYNNGKAVFEGIKNTKKIGKFEKKLPEKTIQNLKEAFDAANFFDFKDDYTSMITDLPTTYIMYTKGKQSKRIRDYHGAPESLKKLEKMLETVAESDGWHKIEKE